jgi:hypothetical protein
MQSVEELLPLKALTGLTFLATSDITDAGLSVLAQLQPLKQLDFERARTVTAQGLVHLTALKGLTQLRAPGSACVFGAHQHCRVLHLKSRCQVRCVCVCLSARGEVSKQAQGVGRFYCLQQWHVTHPADDWFMRMVLSCRARQVKAVQQRRSLTCGASWTACCSDRRAQRKRQQQPAVRAAGGGTASAAAVLGCLSGAAGQSWQSCGS